VQGVGDNGVNELEVMAGRHLRDDTPVPIVDALRGDDVGLDVTVGCDERGAGVIAAGLDGQDHGL
jgi:hypothetical protein